MKSKSEAVPKRPGASVIYRYLRELYASRRGIMAGAVVLLFISRLAGATPALTAQFLIDDVVLKRRTELLLPLTALVAAGFLIEAAASYVVGQMLGLTSARLMAELRAGVQEHLGRLPVQYYDANKTGSLVSRIMTDIEGIRNLVGVGLVHFIGAICTSLIAFVMLLRINAPLTLITIALVAICGPVVRRTMRNIRPIFRERAGILAEMTARLTESIGGVRVVKAMHAESREAAIFSNSVDRLFGVSRRIITTSLMANAILTMLVGLVSTVLMLAGGLILLNGSMSVGEFFSFSMYMGFIIGPVLTVVNLTTSITESIAGLDRMHEVLREQPEDIDPERRIAIGRIAGHVRLDNVVFEYEEGKRVLHGISLEAAPATMTALVGSSGAGKSTVIGLIAAFSKPTAGTVYVDGVDLSTVTLDSYRSQLGAVFQDNFLFDGTIRENILFGRPDASADEVQRAVQAARVDEFASRLEDGLDTIVGERGVKLSGGQRQRIAIARAILAEPKILLLDEATSSLDSESESLIQEGLAAVMKGRTTFVIAHRLSTVRNADQILVLEQGAIVERGTHQELLARRGRYFGLYTRQAGLEANRFINPGEILEDPQPAPVHHGVKETMPLPEIGIARLNERYSALDALNGV